METQYLSITEAAQCCPRRVSGHSVWRWINRGCKARSGEIVKLKAIRQAGVYLVPREALGEFFQRLADEKPVTGQPAEKTGGKHSQKSSAHLQSNERLKAQGL